MCEKPQFRLISRILTKDEALSSSVIFVLTVSNDIRFSVSFTGFHRVHAGNF